MESNKHTSPRSAFNGMPLVDGHSQGTAFIYRDILSREIEIRELDATEIAPEWERLRSALEQVGQDVTRMRNLLGAKIGERQAAIFDAYGSILTDDNLLRNLEEELHKRRLNAEKIVKNVMNEWEGRFRTSAGAAQKEWANDIHDMSMRILRALAGKENNVLADIPESTVLFTPRLLLSDTVHFVKRQPCAIVTQEGGPLSHAALLARSLQVPLITGVDFNAVRHNHGQEVVVDGSRGTVIFNPLEREKKACRELSNAYKRSTHIMLEHSAREAAVLHEHDYSVYANVSSADDIRNAVTYDCDGIGLFRTESLYMQYKSMPGEQEIYEQLYAALAPVKDKEITLRLADLGDDKVLPYLDIGAEHNSALGLRGIRFLLHFRDILKAQLSVFLRLAQHYKVSILIPMVTAPWDVGQTRSLCDELMREMRDDGVEITRKPPLGAMIETPAAVWGIEMLLPSVDFVSIGTNDLIQYMTAANRESLEVWEYYTYGAGLVLNALTPLIAQVKRTQKQCTICGELGGDYSYTNQLIQSGLKKFSVEPPLIPIIKERISRVIDTGESGNRKA
ncbi:MAG: phosphoenolpyruvate--protein phosphotransferase [Chitinivibrionales bacterium]|nr:phosphoenolpyruvate--protein phosphotransferase [Chitinivibrionales bacterium]